MAESHQPRSGPPHKPADNDDDYPPRVPIPMPVPAQQPAPKHGQTD